MNDLIDFLLTNPDITWARYLWEGFCNVLVAGLAGFIIGYIHREQEIEQEAEDAHE